MVDLYLNVFNFLGDVGAAGAARRYEFHAGVCRAHARVLRPAAASAGAACAKKTEVEERVAEPAGLSY